MSLLDEIAEQRVAEARDRGELDNLPGAGRRQTLDDDAMVPEHLRAGYRLLKNAGFIPPEMQLQREINTVEELLEQLPVEDQAGRSDARRRLEVLRMQLAEKRGRGLSMLTTDPAYQQRLLDRLDRRGSDVLGNQAEEGPRE